VPPTATKSATHTATATGTRTNTPPHTATATVTPLDTATATETSTATSTATSTPTPLCGSNVVIADPYFAVTHNLNPPGDEKLKVKGRMQIIVTTPPIDPTAHGLTLTVTDADGAVLLSRFVPPGLSPGGGAPGWKSNAAGWKFQDSAGTLAAGVTKIKLSTKNGPGLVNFKSIGRAGNFQLPPPVTSLRLIVTLGGAHEAAIGQCGQVAFNAPAGPPPLCKLLAMDDRLKCR